MLSRMSSSGARQACNATLGGECRAAGGDGGSRGAAPSTLAYNLVLGCLSRAGRHAEAEALMGQMHEAGVPPDAVTFSSLISLAPAATTAPSRAAEWLSAMKELGVAPDVQVRGLQRKKRPKEEPARAQAPDALGRAQHKTPKRKGPGCKRRRRTCRCAGF